jgi:hypothetical protein
MDPKTRLADFSPHITIIPEKGKVPDKYHPSLKLYPDCGLIRKFLSKEAANHNPNLRICKVERPIRDKMTNKVIEMRYTNTYFHEDDAREVVADYLKRKARRESQDEFNTPPININTQLELPLAPELRAAPASVNPPSEAAPRNEVADVVVHHFNLLCVDVRAILREAQKQTRLQEQTLEVVRMIAGAPILEVPKVIYDLCTHKPS